MTDIDISPEALARLRTDLRVKAAMINMGESIAWGSETALMDAAADCNDALSAALTQSRAETAAVIEQARNAVASVHEWSPYIAGSKESKAWITGHIGATKRADEAIRALTTPDQSSALAAIESAAEARGMRRAAEIEYDNTVMDLRSAILAAIPQGDTTND